MALSYYSNWGAPFQQFEYYSDTTTFSEPELAWNADNCFVDPTNDLLYSYNCNCDFFSASASASASANGEYDDAGSSLLPTFHTLNQQQHYIFPHEDYFHCPKRLKGESQENIYSSFFNGFAPKPYFQDYSPPEIALPMTVAPKLEAGGESLSAQSIAARQRRRRITEKTQELGKLVPGGQKMNTAEMLQSAYKYIKFLQAQFALLDFVASTSHHDDQENIEAAFEGEEELQILLESPLIQEKLYSTEYCLVPHKFVQELGCVDEIVKSNPNLLPTLEKDQ